MNNHKNARLTVFGRQLLVQRILQQGLRFEEGAHAAGVRTGTAYKWLTRYRQEGLYGLNNRSSRPAFRPHAIDDLGQQRCIELHKQRQIYRHISQSLGIGHSSVARILQRMGLTRLANLEPAPSVQCYEHEKPEDLLHLDIRRLGRFHRSGHRVMGDRRQDSPGAGWECTHVAVDDHSSVAFSALYPDERGRSACLVLLQALRYYAGLGIGFSRLLTDNGACYRSTRFQKLGRCLGLKHLQTLHTPKEWQSRALHSDSVA